MTNQQKCFSIVVPVYQNEQNLPTTIPTLLALSDKLEGASLELIFVDDGSTDRSLDILREWCDKHPESIRVVKLTRNFGQIAAIQAGLRETRGDHVGIISADLQDPPELLLEMWDTCAKGHKLVIAERNSRDDGGMVSSFFWYLVSKFALPGYPRGGFDCCVLDRQIVSELNRFHEKNTHIFPLIFSLGYRCTSIPYRRRRRTEGRTQWTLGKKLKLFLDTFIGFSYLPIRSISLLGALVSFSSLMYGAFIAISYFAFGNQYTGWTTLAVLSSVLGGLILVTLGIVGEYLWRILDAVRPRPPYSVDERFPKCD
ncbi:MAG: glycosyltransferase family 2 protein [Bdellovibrionaceae bacterium]|nr:glycosyltransferase family 2 protein [Bdellovibrionales bacterium]MCB9254416.1 glycosyltransferase family 2 protein [Pseudobdellovibrionaceae bacterium]